MPLTKNPASAKTRITVWSLVSLCLVGTVAGLLVLSFQEVQGQVQTLPDGTRVELAGVTHGKRHEHRVGNFWQRWIGGRNGTSVIGTAGSTTTISVTLNPIAANHPDPLDTPVDSLVLWQKVSPGAGAHSDLRSAAAIDKHGCRLRCLGEGWQSYPPGGMQTSAGTSEVQPLTLLAFPRRAAGFQYALVSEDASAPEVTFQLRSTHGSAFPSWSAGAAPTAAAIGRNRFVLKRLEHLTERVPFSQTTAFFECFEGERPVHHWRPDRIAVSDATGNLVETTSNGEPPHQFTFDALCRFEPAWKLRTTFVRDVPMGKPDFTWKVDGVGAPGRGERVDSSQSAHRGALSLKLYDIRGGSQYSLPTISVEAEESPGKYQLALLAVSDQAGHRIPVDRSTAIQLVQGPSQTLAYDFGPYPKGAKKLNLTFGIYGAQTVEFMVKP